MEQELFEKLLQSHGLRYVQSPDDLKIFQWYKDEQFGGAFQLRKDGKIGWQQSNAHFYIQSPVCADVVFTADEFVAFLAQI